MSMDELVARRVTLAQAIETADTEGTLLTQAQRDRIDREARHAAGLQGEPESKVDASHFLDLRSQLVIAAVVVRLPGLALLQAPRAFERWLAIGIPLGALLIGVLTDAVGNPHRVDLVSLPLLGIVAWNLAMYAVLFLGWVMAGPAAASSWPARLGRWTDGERALRHRPGNLRARVTTLFHLRWYQATQALHGQRVKRVLHLAAAAWAVGVALSLLIRGLVVEYRVGWESTFLGPEQVHAILSVLRLAALLLFPFEPFSVEEVASLRFSQGGGAIAGARWVYLYVALLIVVVVVPRLMLATAAFVRGHLLARDVKLDLRDPYFQRVLSLLTSARVTLCAVTHRVPDRTVLGRVLDQETSQGSLLLRSAQDDALRWIDLSGSQPPAQEPPPKPTRGWLRHWIGLNPGNGRATSATPDAALAQARDDADVVLHVVGSEGDLAAARPLVQWLGKPVLLLVNDMGARVGQEEGGAGEALLAQCRQEARQRAVPAQVLPFSSFADCWVQERVLLDTLAALLAPAKQEGFARIAAAWNERNQARFGHSIQAVADHLLFAAQQVEEVRSSAITVRNLIPSQRVAQAQARQQAMQAVVKRLDASAAELFDRLRELHGVAQNAGVALQLHLQEQFVVQQPVDAPQAGMAGVATGAAMGASVDLLVGGLTLGAATALGALVGGGAAFIAAAWKNRDTSSGATLIQLSDDMMQALVEAALLRYLAVAHCARGSVVEGGELRPFSRSEVVAAVEAGRARLLPVWAAARSRPDLQRLAPELTAELDAIARRVLEALYPGQRA